MGLIKTPDVDQTADSKVVTAQVPVERVEALEEVGKLHVGGQFFQKRQTTSIIHLRLCPCVCVCVRTPAFV